MPFLFHLFCIYLLYHKTVASSIPKIDLQPKILSKSTGLSPLTVLLTVIVAGGIFGFWGMVLGVPVVATFKMFAAEYYGETIS
ncbi:MAG: AI-2E family transporter [Clostridia bacterium]|nr:AI-2E family transporter [Clostridia bacterium]